MNDINQPPEPATAKHQIPAQGVPHDQLLRQLADRRQHDARWHDGRTFSLVYHASDEHTKFLEDVFCQFFGENALNPGAFRSLQQLEMEVVSMAAGLLGGDAQTVGTMTSGGTESLFLALKTYRDRARAQSPALTEPEAVVPISVHPAFDKAAHSLGVKLIHVPVAADFRVDLAAVRAAIGPRTILLLGSAPAYPQGVIDPIGELAALASARGIGMHVDACLGGFLLPFVRDLGYPIPPFDLRVPGVTSISADLHKYGFAAKGASVLLYRDAELRRHQFFVRTDWPGGLFGSTTMAGTRPGGPIAAAWAALRAIGRDGYLRLAEQIMATTQRFRDGISQIPGLRILGQPEMSVFAFTADSINIFAVADAMEARGWHIDRQQQPSSIHLMITPAHKNVVDTYLEDLRASVDYVALHPELGQSGNAAAYGLLTSLPERGLVNELVLQHIDQLYRP